MPDRGSAREDVSTARHIVLVPGAGHGAWCWERVVPLLAARGHGVVALDPPGLGADATPPAAVTFATCVERVLAAVTAGDGRVLLVGHSMAGAAISQAAEMLPQRIHGLVYVSAALPLAGESLQSLLETLAARGLLTDRDTMRIAPDGQSFDFAPESVRRTLYPACPPDVAEAAVRRLRPQPLAPFATSLELTPGRFGALAKTYVICTDDCALSRPAQEWLCARVPGITTHLLHADHSPFYSAPEALAALIDAAAA